MYLSIIIPVYKVELYLRECLDSIAASPLDCWEAILVDDGSPDACPQICDEYAVKDKRFRVIHQQNAGVAAARNAGLDVAQGEWVWFVDSDDVVNMRPVTEMVEWLKANEDETAKLYKNKDKNKDYNENETLRYETERGSYENDDGTAELDDKSVDLVMFDLKTFKDNGNENETQGYETAWGAYENENCQLLTENKEVRVKVNVSVDKNQFLSQHVSFFHQQYWFRRSERFRFTKGIRVSEDLELMYKYFTLCQQPVKFHAKLYHYRVRKTSVTQDENYRRKAVEDLPIVLKNLAEWNNTHCIETEPWYDFRIMKMMQNLLYSASFVRGLNTKDFQVNVKDLIDRFEHQQFPFVRSLKIKLAIWNINLYTILNRCYLKFRSIE